MTSPTPATERRDRDAPHESGEASASPAPAARASGARPGVIALGRFCVENLPLYMVLDQFTLVDGLPKTSTGKTDYQRLEESIGGRRA